MGSTQESVFSAYRTGENRVTGSIIAVLRSLSLRRFQTLLADLAGNENAALIDIVNQKCDENSGIPDAEISADFRITIETKIRTNSVRVDQLERHLQRFEKPTLFDRLVVLTPDPSLPPAISNVNNGKGDERIVWTSFKDFAGKITALLDGEGEVISEREEFLLRHLLLMFEEEQLFGREVVVVAARKAWPEYQKLSAYLCQPNRSLGGATYLAFYANGEICDRVPKIKKVFPDVELGAKHEAPELQRAVEGIISDGQHSPGQRNQIVLLTGPEESETIKLDSPVENNLKSKQQPDLPVAFTMGQRYVSLENLRRARTTSDLIAAN